MIRFASIALTSVLGVAGIACAVPASASPSFAVEVGVPGYGGGPYAYARGPYGGPYVGYWHRDFDRDYYRHRFYWDHYHHGYRR